MKLLVCFHRERERQRETETEIERQTDRQRQRQIYTDTHTEIGTQKKYTGTLQRYRPIYVYIGVLE